jgi:predicted ATP-grasp superfamily ATP-dependent carboligase
MEAPTGRVLGESVAGLSYVRSLHRRGVPTLLLTPRGWIDRPSRYGLTVDLPGIVDEPEVWPEVLVSTAERLPRRPVLLVTFDHAVLFVGHHADELGRLYDFLIPPLSTSAAIVDKHRQYELAAAAGIPIPRTVFPKSADEALTLAREIGFPCLLKPHVGSAGATQLAGRPRWSTTRRCFERCSTDSPPTAFPAWSKRSSPAATTRSTVT